MSRRTIGCKSFVNKIGILIAQLGTPEAPTTSALRAYLKQFLSDPRVVEVNRVLWWLILRLFILTTRPSRSANLYKGLWTEEGSPLLVITKRQVAGLQKALSGLSAEVEVDFGMRYGKPSLEHGIDTLIDRGCSRILLLPMYPQYSAATSASTYDVVFAHLLKRRFVPTLRVAEPFFVSSEYILPLAHIINSQMSELSSPVDHLILSYHGVPQSYVDKGDPYCCMCTETTMALTSQLNIPRDRVIHTYQSRFGKDPWLKPYTDETIADLAAKGVKRIAVACPGFPTDCLETIDEIGREARHEFMKLGGEDLIFITGLNDCPEWIEGMRSLVEKEISSWLEGETLKADVGITCPGVR